MRIIPVMDLMDGKVVHAVRGERDRYRPLESVLTRSPNPLLMGKVLKELGFEELYIADLDAIRSTGRNLDSIGQIVSECGMKPMVDAGFRRAEEVKDYLEMGVEKTVLATETLGGWNEISKIITNYGAQVVASIDMKFGRVIAESKTMSLPLEELITNFEAKGALDILVLSLDRVGTIQGPDYEILKKASRCASIPVLAGGGIKNVRDIRRLKRLGISGVLIATALYAGIVSKDDLDQLLHE